MEDSTRTQDRATGPTLNYEVAFFKVDRVPWPCLVFRNPSECRRFAQSSPMIRSVKDFERSLMNLMLKYKIVKDPVAFVLGKNRLYPERNKALKYGDTFFSVAADVDTNSEYFKVLATSFSLFEALNKETVPEDSKMPAETTAVSAPGNDVPVETTDLRVSSEVATSRDETIPSAGKKAEQLLEEVPVDVANGDRMPGVLEDITEPMAIDHENTVNNTEDTTEEPPAVDSTADTATAMDTEGDTVHEESSVKNTVEQDAAKTPEESPVSDVHQSEKSKPPSSATAVTPVASVAASVSKKNVEVIELVEFNDVKPLLKRGGFIFRRGLYALPGMDPEKNPSAQADVDFFASEEDFRRNLCNYGVPDSHKWTDDARELIGRWVRYYIFGSVWSRSTIPFLDEISPCHATKLLLRIGFQHHFGLGDEWYFPGVKEGYIPRELGVNEFSEDHDMLKRVIRFGFPDNCRWDEIAEAERIQLIVHLAHMPAAKPSKYGNTFERLSLTDTDEAPLTASGRKRRRCSVDSDSSPPMGSAKKSPSVKRHPSASAKKARKKPSQSPVQSALMTPPAARRDRVNSSQMSSSSKSKKCQPPKSIPMSPAFEGSDRERLFACLDALKSSHSIDALEFDKDKSSEFSSQMDRVQKFLSAAILSEGEHGTRKSYPPALYVCGVPGIGKTMGIKRCCEAALESESDLEIKYLHVNAGHLRSETGLVSQICDGLGLNAKRTKKMAQLRKKLQGGKILLIAVIDEIDLLVAGPGKEKIAQELLSWAESKETQFVLIGVSNSTGNDKYARLQELGKFDGIVTFQPYASGDLARILKARVGTTVINQKALEFIGKKVAGQSGDARKALEMASSAVRAVLDCTEGAAFSSGPLVKIQHVVQASKVGQQKFSEVVRSTPTMGKVVLCILCVMGRAKFESISLKKIKSLVQDCLNRSDRLDAVLPTHDFISVLENLVDHDLLATGGSRVSEVPVSELLDIEISLRTPCDDLEKELEDELQSSFYHLLRDKAGKIFAESN